MSSTTQVPFLYQRVISPRRSASPAIASASCSRPSAATSVASLDLHPIDVIAALLARRARRPVKIEFERLEVKVMMPPRAYTIATATSTRTNTNHHH